MIDMRVWIVCTILAGIAWAPATTAGDKPAWGGMDVFELEYASDPQIAPDGSRVVYVRNSMDVMTDRRRSRLWSVAFDGADHRPLGDGEGDDTSPRWSPDGTRLLYLSERNGSTQLVVRWMDSGQVATLTQLTRAPRDPVWSPDGRWIAFAMFVPAKSEPFVELPPKPDGAEWAEPPRVIERLTYRFDGRGYLEDGYNQLFILPADGGTPRQLTTGKFNHDGRPGFTPDGGALVFSANRRPDWEYEPLDTEVYSLSLADGAIATLTDRYGPDREPVVSPEGDRIAYLGFDDRLQGYQVTRLYLMQRDGSDRRVLTADLDRSVSSPVWDAGGRGLYFRYSDSGNGKIGYVTLDGNVRVLAGDVGGTSLGRPYASGSFSAAGRRFAYTRTRPDRPADVAVGELGDARPRVLTSLNDDLLGQRELGALQELRCRSSFDGRPIQGWIVKPPGFDPQRKYPLILEIHGGPFADYGDRFAAEFQLYAAAGYAVLYVNPRGSTSYGEEFGNLIHHAYPGHDYDDLMSAVDAALELGWIDPQRLFVTGGSGGGVLSAWIVGHTDRFRAAVVAKPVINWYSFALTADAYNFFYKYWFPGPPWEQAEHYLARSPLAHVGRVKTPTMLLTGEADYRTPISESEQFYQALKLRKVDTALVRIPDASHGIANRPSHLMAKVAHVLRWFERYGGNQTPSVGASR